MKQPTESECRVLRFLEQHIRERGYPPTQDEAAEQLGISRACVRYYLKCLEKKGCITYNLATHRGIAIKPKV